MQSIMESGSKKQTLMSTNLCAIFMSASHFRMTVLSLQNTSMA
jgi:hypothetical protein